MQQPTSRGATLTLVAPGGIRTALQRLIPLFEERTGHKVAPTFISGGSAKSQDGSRGELFDDAGRAAAAR